MTDTEPRIPPLARGTLPDDVRVALQGWLRPDATEVPAPLDTLALHPDLARSYLAFNRHLLFESSLPPRDSRAPRVAHRGDLRLCVRTRTARGDRVVGKGSTTKQSLARRMVPTPPAGRRPTRR